MPKKRRERAREQPAEVATAGEVVHAPERLPDNRPRTRARVKQEQSQELRASPLADDIVLKSTGIVTRSKAKLTQPKDSTTGLGQSEQTRQFQQAKTAHQKNQSQNLGKVVELSTEVITFPSKGIRTKQQPQSSKQPDLAKSESLARKDETSKPKHSALTTWLSEVESPHSLQSAHIPSTLHEPEDTMNSSSTSRESTRELLRSSGENESTAKGTGYKSVKVSNDKLRLRRISRKASTDERLAYLRSILKTELPETRLEDIKGLKSVLEEFLKQIRDNPKEICWPFIDDFTYSFDKGKSKIDYPIINGRYFEIDLERCLTGNEAVLQRTIMMHIINKYWLGKIFDWNSEGQWSQPKDTRLPSRLDDDISLPKPDLAISFTLESFTGETDDSDPFPLDLKSCLSPDGGDRCFPFLFMEVKKAGADLQEAYMANLHSASQALYNMYNWMVRAGQEQEFINTVRVFSFVFNAQDMAVRVHRAEELETPEKALRFHFDEYAPLARYTKDQACLLIRTILSDYAAPELYPTLKAAFVEITSLEDKRVTAKRKGGTKRSPSTKRARRGQSNGQNTGQSFNMANLSTED